MRFARPHHAEVFFQPRVLHHGSRVAAHQHRAMSFKDVVVVERVERFAVRNGALCLQYHLTF